MYIMIDMGFSNDDQSIIFLQSDYYISIRLTVYP